MNVLRRVVMVVAGLALVVLSGLRDFSGDRAFQPEYFVYVASTRGSCASDIVLVHASGKPNIRLAQSPCLDYPNLDSFTWAPDGRWLYFTQYNPGEPFIDTYRLPIYGGQQRRLTKNEDYEYRLALSPDGKWIYYDLLGPPNRPRLARMRLDGSQQETLLKDSDSDLTGFDWSADGQWILYMERDNPGLYRIRSDGTEHERLYRELDFEGEPLNTATPGWRYFHDVSAESLVRVRDDGSRVQRLDAPDPVHRALEIKPSPDERWLAAEVGAWNGTVVLLFALDGDNKPLLRPSGGLTIPQNIPTRTLWMPHSRWLLINGHTGSYLDDAATGIFMVDPATGHHRHLTPDFRRTWLYSIAPDQEWVIFAGYKAGQVGSTDPHLYRVQLAADQHGKYRYERLSGLPVDDFITWSPDGEWLYFRADTASGTHQIMRVQPDSKQVQHLRSIPPDMFFIGWVPGLAHEDWNMGGLLVVAIGLVLGGWVRRLPGVGWATGWLGRRDSSSGEMD
jgi:Tol biopolymer transport system component